MSTLITDTDNLNNNNFIDLNKIFSLTYNFDLLKNILSNLLNDMNKTNQEINNLKYQLSDKDSQINNLQSIIKNLINNPEEVKNKGDSIFEYEKKNPEDFKLNSNVYNFSNNPQPNQQTQQQSNQPYSNKLDNKKNYDNKKTYDNKNNDDNKNNYDNYNINENEDNIDNNQINIPNNTEPLLEFDNDKILEKLNLHDEILDSHTNLINNLLNSDRINKKRLNDIDKKLHEISIKVQDFNIYDLIQSNRNSSSGNNPNMIISLIKSLEKKCEERFNSDEEKIKKIDEDLFKLMKDFQNLKNSQDLTSHNIEQLKNKNEIFEKKLTELNNKLNESEKRIYISINEGDQNLAENFNNTIEQLKDMIKNNNLENLDKLKPVQIEEIKEPEIQNEPTNNDNYDNNSAYVDDINRRLRDLEKEVKKILINNNKTNINDELNEIKIELSNKCNKSDYELLKNLLFDFEKNLNTISDRLEDFIMNNPMNEDLKKLQRAIESLTTKYSELTGGKIINTSMNESSNISNIKNMENSNKFVDNQTFTEFKNQVIKEFKSTNSNFSELRRLIDEILESLKNKATYKDLKALEDDINAKLEELKIHFTKKFADKIETSKNIKYLDSQIKNIINVYIKKMEKGDNWLLAKKPLGNLCASCESYIGELKDNSNYVPWNKYPARDPNDKLYRMGNGYSKMLQMIQIDDNGKEIDNSFSRTVGNNNLNGSINNSSILPKITNQSGMNLNTAMDEEETIGNVVGHSDEQNTQPKIMKIIKKNKNQN